LYRYGSEVDVAFVRKSIGNRTNRDKFSVPLDLVGTRVSYMVQEAAVVMKVCKILLISRKYPSTCEGVVPTLRANLDEVDEPEAKTSL
ncbi:hypothetical protein EDC04DRAFT_2972255, partial [Pisolithus marmoratus]